MTAELLQVPSRQAGVLDETEHRPWPVPEGPWVMAQTWDDLLFAHWRVPAESLARFVPQALEIDRYDGSAWLGVTPFVLTDLRLRATLPLPWLSTFPELNVRTYVIVEDKPGVWFFSLDAGSRLAVEAARRMYKLPYFHARMSAESGSGGIDYRCERLEDPDRRFDGRYRPSGDEFEAEPGSLEHFLTERYCLYAVDRGRIGRAEIHHPPWPLRPAELEPGANTMPPPELALEGPPLCHFARRQDVVIWPLRPV